MSRMPDEGTVIVASLALLMTDTYACLWNLISFEHGSVTHRKARGDQTRVELVWSCRIIPMDSYFINPLVVQLMDTVGFLAWYTNWVPVIKSINFGRTIDSPIQMSLARHP
jgi:hypothetical protein